MTPAGPVPEFSDLSHSSAGATRSQICGPALLR